jgi:uncharacterized membrane protein (DUF485 family)
LFHGASTPVKEHEPDHRSQDQLSGERKNRDSVRHRLREFDQAAHLGFILLAVAASGWLTAASPWPTETGWWLVLGYTFITMPAWVLIEFGVHGLVAGVAPDFGECRHKYAGMLERGLITTFVLLGQYVLVPLVALPRLWLAAPRNPAAVERRTSLFLAELLASTALALATGLVLRLAIFHSLV